jgi:hypothetical protein
MVMRSLTLREETLLVEQNTDPNWDEYLTNEEADLLDALVQRGAANIVTLFHPTDRARSGQFYLVTDQGVAAIACAQIARRLPWPLT